MTGSGRRTDGSPGWAPGDGRDETLAEAALRTTFARVKRAILFTPVLALLIAALPVILSSTTELYLGGSWISAGLRVIREAVHRSGSPLAWLVPAAAIAITIFLAATLEGSGIGAIIDDQAAAVVLDRIAVATLMVVSVLGWLIAIFTVGSLSLMLSEGSIAALTATLCSALAGVSRSREIELHADRQRLVRERVRLESDLSTVGGPPESTRNPATLLPWPRIAAAAVLVILAVLALTWPITAATTILATLIGVVWAVVVWWGLYTGTRLLRVRSSLTRDRTTSWGLWWGAFVLFAALYRATVERVPFEATVVFVTMLLALSAMLVASRRNVWTRPLYRQVLADSISRTQLQIARIDQQLAHRPYLAGGPAGRRASPGEGADGGAGT